MAKVQDPAFLFYSSDFLTGTLTMSNDQVGMYIRLLCLQHQKGRLREKDMLSICSAHDEEVFSKFSKDEQGMYYNERLEYESVKRKQFAESRRINALGRNNKPKNKKKDGAAYAQHMENENEIENKDVNVFDKVTSFYKSEFEKAPDEPQKNMYGEFYQYITKTNPQNEVTAWVKLKNQLTYDQFKKLLEQAGNLKAILDKVDIAINKKSYLSGKSSVYLTLKNWISK